MLTVAAAVAEGRDDWPAELRHLGQCGEIHLDDEFLKAVSEASCEGLVRLENEDVPRAQRISLVVDSNQASQRSVM